MEEESALITEQSDNLNDTNDHNHHPHSDNLNPGVDEASGSGIISKLNDVPKGTKKNDSHLVLAELAFSFAETFKNEIKIQRSLDNERVSEKSTKPEGDSSSSSSSAIKRLHPYKNFTPKKINYCILSSENTRVVCSIMIALMVVFSDDNLPQSKGIMASRPLYVLLLTDVCIVIARLILGRRIGRLRYRKEEEPRQDSWDGAVKVLEISLVFYQTIRGLFIDCSFYMVIVVCGRSL